MFFWLGLGNNRNIGINIKSQVSDECKSNIHSILRSVLASTNSWMLK